MNDHRRLLSLLIASALLLGEIPPAAAQALDLAAPPAPPAALVEASSSSWSASEGASRKSVSLRPTVTALVESINSEPTDFDFKDSDIIGILRTFAAKFNKNIIAGPGVGGRVTLRLRGVPFDEAFRTLLDQMSLVAIQKSPSVIEVIKAADMPYLVEAFPLKYRFAQEVKTTLDGMLKGTEKERTIVTYDGPSNSLFITSTNDVLQRMKATLDQLDVNPPQISIKARLIEVQAGNLLNWGVAWASRSSFRGGVLGTVNNPKSFPNSTQNGASASAFQDGLIAEVLTVLDKTQLDGLLNVIKTDTAAKTISEPNILTGNNKKAKIHVGQNLPVKTSQTTQTSTTQSVQYIPEGVDLEVTPIVAPGSSMISFEIKVGVSELVGFQDNNPITSERVAQTAVTVESGKTVVIGGLIKDKLTDSDSGIPILKDIPLLGWFFKTKRKEKNRTELLIFITPELAVEQLR